MITEPPITPVTTPEAFTVATEGFPLLQVPPDIASAKVLVIPAQKVVVPVIVPAETAELTVTVAVALDVPQPPETV